MQNSIKTVLILGLTYGLAALTLCAQDSGGPGNNIAPEPGTITLAALGGGCLLLRWGWKHRRNAKR